MGKKDPNAPKRPLSAYFIFMGLFFLVYMYCHDSFCCCRWEKGGSQSCESWRQDRRHRQGCCLLLFLISHLYCRKWGKCGRSWMRRRRWITSFSCVNLLLLQAPYEKKAEAAKKKYAEEMAAYEGWIIRVDVNHSLCFVIAFSTRCK